MSSDRFSSTCDHPGTYKSPATAVIIQAGTDTGTGQREGQNMERAALAKRQTVIVAQEADGGTEDEDMNRQP